MTIDLSNIADIELWKEARKQHQFKQTNAEYLNKFNNKLIGLSDKYNGCVSYLSSVDDVKCLTYTEGTPIFSLFKFVPQSYFIDEFEPCNYWKESDIDQDVIDRLLSYDLFKYDLPTIPFAHDAGYYLYVCSSILDIDKVSIVRCAAWALKNNERVIIRLGTTRDVHDKNDGYISLINALRMKGITEKNLIVDEKSHIDDLVVNCKAMWSAASGVGFAALLRGKPVSYHMRDYDYSYGPIAQFTASADVAFQNTIDYDIVRRYFTWYYNKISIDLKHENYSDMIESRLHRYFKLNHSRDEMLAP